MAAPNATLETAVAAVTALGGWISLHTATPGTTGASEASGGGYAREQTTWSAGSSDGIVNGSAVDIAVAAGTYTHFGVWSAETGGTFRIGGPLSSAATLGSAGTVNHTPSVQVASGN